MRSIRARLLAGLLALVAAVSLLVGALTYVRVLDETSRLFDYQLRQMALSLRNQVSVTPHLQLPQDAPEVDYVVQIWDLFGSRVYMSRSGLPLSNQIVMGYADLVLNGEHWRAYGLSTEFGVIQVAQPWRVRRQLAGAAALRVVLPLLPLLLLAVAAMVWVIGRGLAPLSRVAQEVQRRDARSLAPIHEGPLPREVAPMVAALNRLLQRLAEAFAAQRSFVADAAHELRSPLTAVRLHLQLLDRAPDAQARQQARDKLSEAVDRAARLVEQLLTLARNEPEAPAQLQPVALDEAARAATGEMAALAAARGTDLGLTAPQRVTVRGDAAALRALVRNLVDNAVRYTPPGGHVQVRVGAAAGGAWLEVEDDGPGLPAAEQGRVFDRFYRRNRTDEEGSGLGLAIVKAIADRHGAAISLGDAIPHGLRVRVGFPAEHGSSSAAS
ncbi:MAG TPA: ATP-binding protein [Nevskia sp.]|nr:ATP-binding protein [Nevskia sp.]